jgi:pimeloyl-ACP methyl ester carboxylesterase
LVFSIRKEEDIDWGEFGLLSRIPSVVGLWSPWSLAMNRLARPHALAILMCSLMMSLIAARAQSSHDFTTQPGVDKSIDVPFDRQSPGLGTFALQYELGRAFDPAKATVFVIAPLQTELFGDQFNVVGIIGRASNGQVMGKIRTGGSVDWELAYRILRAEEWVDDIEAVRMALVGSSGQISLYGRSGGGLLVDQYMAKYPEHVRTAFTQAAVNRYIDADLRLNSDHYWEEIGQYDRSLQDTLLRTIAAHPDNRDRIILLLQRQNFFVPAAQLNQARAELIHALANWESEKVADYSKRYQVEQILQQLRDATNPAGNVRLYEFYAPLASLLEQNGTKSSGRIDPDMEVLRMFADPLLKLANEGRIQSPTMNLSNLNHVGGSVYLLAGAYDHTADYRSQIALASHFPNHRLLLLADDHDFLALSKTGLYPALIQAALLEGADGDGVRKIETMLASLRYTEF